MGSNCHLLQFDCNNRKSEQKGRGNERRLGFSAVVNVQSQQQGSTLHSFCPFKIPLLLLVCLTSFRARVCV